MLGDYIVGAMVGALAGATVGAMIADAANSRDMTPDVNQETVCRRGPTPPVPPEDAMHVKIVTESHGTSGDDWVICWKHPVR